MSAIASVRARRVWDSRGHPTVEVEIETEKGARGRAIAPAGASRGSREAMDLRDGGSALRGRDVGGALSNVNGPIAAALLGIDAKAQSEVDAAILALDPSPQLEKLGGNATVATSLALIRAAANEAGRPLWRHVAVTFGTTPTLPLPEIQIFGGGAHAGRRVDIQDFMVTVPGATSFQEVMEITSEIYFAAGDIMASRGRLAGVADEGGWWPEFSSNEEALETLLAAIEKAGETPGERVAISLDIAASEFGNSGRYRLALEDRQLDTEGMIDLLAEWLDAYPILSVEDPLAEDDRDGMSEFTRRFGREIQIVGDDYLATNAGLVSDAIADGACNAVLLKINQVGTVTQAVEAYRRASSAGWRSIVSARSGETEDVSISHLATGLGCGQLKVGSFARSERMAKWNECLRIADDLEGSSFAGGASFANTWWGRRVAGQASI